MFGIVISAGSVLATSLPFIAGPALADPVTSSAVTNTAVLGGTAFANAVGLLRVNQAAGVGNEQVNAATIGVARTASDSLLAGSIGQKPSQTTGSILRVHDRAIVAPGAFARAAGLVQVDQTAGDGNASSNAFTLRIRP